MDPRALPDDVEALKPLFVEEIAKRDAQLVERDTRIRVLESENRLLRIERFAPKSERRASDGFAASPGQMS
ncbi:MAG: hypothetical protein JNK02_04605 [Planctomycetes bacterium]|nr:hypothetical protein [Planctomycetota bacterium]